MTPRSITMGGNEYAYFVGRGNVHIRLRKPNGFEPGTVAVPSNEVVRCTPDTFERGHWKKTSDGMVTPGLLADYIRSCTKFEGGRFMKKTAAEHFRSSVVDGLLWFTGLWNCRSTCHVRAWRNGDQLVVMATELPDNPGTSVTNSWGQPVDLAKQVLRAFGAELIGAGALYESIVWVEHWPERDGFPEHWDRVWLKPRYGLGFVMDEARHPWSRLNEGELRELGVLP